MEKAVLEKIGVLRRAYQEKEQAYEAEYEKLQAYVEKYLDENNIWGNKELLGDVVHILPDSGLRFRLIDCLYDLHVIETEQRAGKGTNQKAAPAGGRDMGQSGICGPRHDPKALAGIKCMAEAYREKKQEFRAEQKKLQEYVNSYLDQYGIRNDLAKLNELVDVLPGGIVRFWLLDNIYFLEEKEAEHSCVQGEGAEPHMGDGGVQASGGIQPMGI